MKFFGSASIFIGLFVLSSAKIIHHGHGHGGHDAGHGGVAVHYSVVTEHKADHYGHGGGGHNGGHAIVHTWGHDGAHKGGDYGVHGGAHGGHYGGHNDGHDHHAYPKYEFSYGVKDLKSGDIKSQSEHRDGGNVKGSYTVKEADGTTRHVEYSADKHKGFNAVVHTLGHAHGGHDAGHGHSGHGYDGHGHGGHGKASSFVVVKKQEEKKH